MAQVLHSRTIHLNLSTCLTMSSREDHLLRDLYGGDLEYHQDYHGDDQIWHKTTSIIVPAILLILGLIYSSLHALDYNLLPLSELLWNGLVFITPSRLLTFFDDGPSTSRMSESSINTSQTHAAKSEMMRRILGFDRPGGIMGTVAQAGRRRLSSISGINIAPRGDDESPPGLGNWDNSCYQNSVLQGLASLDSFSTYLVDPTQSNTASEYKENLELKMSDSLRGLIAKLKDPLNNGKRIWTPPALKSMSSWQQQDAQEYYSKVLDEIDKEIDNAAKTMKPPQGLGPVQDPEEQPKRPVQIRKFELLAQSAVRNPLEGLLAQRVGCTRCGYSEGLSMIPFNCLTVPLGKEWYYDVSDCLDEYTKLETIEGVECGRCTLLKTQRLLNVILERTKDASDDNQVRISASKRLQAVTEALEEDDYEEKTLTQKCNLPPKSRMNTTKSRQAAIARPPKSLAVHVNRSLFDERTGELKKNYAEVRFPKVLDLGPWCLGSTAASCDVDYEEWLLDPAQSMIAGTEKPSRIHGPLYELRAVVTHYGRHENGHYICYRKHPVSDGNDQDVKSEQWWRLSDDDVMKVTEENVLGQGGVFMLFYDCVEPASHRASGLPASEAISAVDTIKEVSVAAKIPLPDDSDDDLDLSDVDDQSLSQVSREQSVATTISECGDEGSGEEQEYQPTKAIHIPPRFQSNGVHHEDENQRHSMQSSSTMVMV